MGSATAFRCVFFALCAQVVVQGIEWSSSIHCARRKEISPCTCSLENSMRYKKVIKVTCEGMVNFQQVITALKDNFEKTVYIELKIHDSTLDDLPQLSFQQLGLNISQLHLNHNNLSALPESVFAGLGETEMLSLTDNPLCEIPQQILKLMPRIKVLDLNGAQIVNITSSDFQGLKTMHTLTMHNNLVRKLDVNSLPPTIRYLALSSNRIPNLNGALRKIKDLEWLFLNDNDLETLDGELPEIKPPFVVNTHMKLLQVNNNRLKRVPQELRQFRNLKTLTMSHNQIVSLDGALSTTRLLDKLDLAFNNISILYPYDFRELLNLGDILLGHNRISNLNGSLLPLKNLRHLNLTHNEIVDFNLQEIRGLRKIEVLDASHNKIRVISGKFGNSVEPEPKVQELRMEYNELRYLRAGLTGFKGLQRVILRHNVLESITADDIRGLDDLLFLDISYNYLTTLDGTSQVILPALEELRANHNWMVSLETDFDGLPKLCWADFSHNRILNVSAELARKTQCRLYGVNSTLRIYLQGNPAMCDEEAITAIKQLESRNNTKVHGINECPPTPPPVVVTTTTTTVTTVEDEEPTTTSASPVVPVTVVRPTAELVVDPPNATSSTIEAATMTTTTTVAPPVLTTATTRVVVPTPAPVKSKTTPAPPKQTTTPKLRIIEISEQLMPNEVVDVVYPLV
uniref:Insulin-like growth factor-binding protein complex acid labile subunit n=1 Tax=Lygus hesperus TaxID=30085 RepID=A0A0A9ZD31_LYGHE